METATETLEFGDGISGKIKVYQHAVNVWTVSLTLHRFTPYLGFDRLATTIVHSHASKEDAARRMPHYREWLRDAAWMLQSVVHDVANEQDSVTA